MGENTTAQGLLRLGLIVGAPFVAIAGGMDWRVAIAVSLWVVAV